MATKTKKKTEKKAEPTGRPASYFSRAEYEKKLMTERDAVDPHRPSAWGVRPLMRLRLADPATYIGHILIDVVAITEGRNGRDTYHCLSCMNSAASGTNDHDGSWVASYYSGNDLIDIMEHYEVVS